MKSNDKRVLHDEFTRPARDTVYEVTFFLETADGLETFDTMKCDAPPLLPDVGEFLSIDWIEDEDETEVRDAVPADEIGTDRRYSCLTSMDLKVTDVSTTYSKRALTGINASDGDGVKRTVTVKKTVTVTTDY